jgi:hypothetical protein
MPRPVFQCFDPCVRNEIIRQVEVTEEADQARGESARLFAEDALQKPV